MSERILIVRLGAMGDILHALPAAASLKATFPDEKLAWAVEPRWLPLLEGNPCVDETLVIDRRSYSSVRASCHRLRERPYRIAIDFQGLLKSAVVAKLSRAPAIVGYQQPREWPAQWFYSRRVETRSGHVVDQHLDLAAVAAAGGFQVRREFPLPAGQAEGRLPGEYVLASPAAGWVSKEWPPENWKELATMLRSRGLPLVLNGSPKDTARFGHIAEALLHASSIAGLIHATRNARFVVGVDSGPMHLAAALAKPGVAIFGPTDPNRNGPYGGSLGVLRAPDAVTSYKRDGQISASMRAITPQMVCNALGF